MKRYKKKLLEELNKTSAIEKRSFPSLKNLLTTCLILYALSFPLAAIAKLRTLGSF